MKNVSSRKMNRFKKELFAFLFSTLVYSATVHGQLNPSASSFNLSNGQLQPSSSSMMLTKSNLVSSNATLSSSNSEIQKMLQHFDKQIYFTENRGQWPDHVLYKADFPLGQALATKQGMIVGTFDPTSIAVRNKQIIEEEQARQQGLPYTQPQGSIKGHGWMMDFVNSSSVMSIESRDRHTDDFNYLDGATATTADNYQEIWYKNVYDNVDVRYYPSEVGTLEYDIVCKPGFNKNNINLKFDGIDRILINKNGHLILKTSVGDMDFPAPIAYQQINGQRKSVSALYKLTGDNELKFELGSYDVAQPLIIDPIALRWATWITNNSASADHGHCIWVDPSDGAIYVAARFAGTGLITVNAFQTAYAGGSGDDMVLGKYLEPDTIGGPGTRVWQTYLGGNGEDNPYAMEQGPDGNLYIVGLTQSTNFPLSHGTAFNGGGASINNSSQKTDNVFIVKFNTAGTSYKSAIVGGDGNDDPYDLRITSSGDIVVSGLTTSKNLATLFPNKGASNTNNGGNDVLIFKINSDLSAISWMKNYGGSGNDQANIMLINNTNGDIFLAGQTASGNFPTTNPRQAGGLGGSQDGFIQKLNSSGTTLWSSYFKSASGKSSAILCMEFNTTKTKLYFGGITGGLNSSNISTSGVFNKTYGGSTNDFFVARMDTNQTFNMSTYLGGSGNEINMMGLNVDLNNDVYIFGYSNSANFPITSDALQSSLNLTGSGSNNDKTFSKLHSDLSSVVYSTFYGGSNDDYDPVGERGIKFSNCRIYTIVTSESNNIPLTKGALTITKTSSSSIYEPGVVVWANPPDLIGNTISGSQNICPGSIPADLTGSVPAYVLPTLSRNSVNSSYPVSYGSAATYTWQSSIDSVNWTNIPGGTTQNLTGGQIGHIYQKTYFRRIIGGDACVLSGPSAQIVTVKTLIGPGVVTNVTCFGANTGSITVNATDGTQPYSYSWTGGATTSSISGKLAGTYSVIVTDHAGCKDTAAFTITQPASAVSAITASTPATCAVSDGSASVTASGGIKPYTYLWSNNATTTSISSITQGVYTVTIKDSNNCALQVKDTVKINNTTNVNAGADAVITCITGPQISLNGSSTTSGVTYSWTAFNGGNIVSGGNTASPVVNAAGSYILTVSKALNGCIKSDTAVVTTNNTPPTVTITQTTPLTFCQGGSVVLKGNGAVSYHWSNGATTSSISVSAQGNYSVTGTDSKSCTATSTGTAVTINANPQVSINTLTLCEGTSGNLCATSTGSSLTYAWNSGLTDQCQTISVPGTYSVTVTDGNNCVGSSSRAVTYIEPPALVVTKSGPTTFCQGDSVTLTASGATNYLWNTGSTATIIKVKSGGLYTVRGNNGGNCNISVLTLVTVNSFPAVTITPSGSTTICQGSSLTLSASGAATYVWSNNKTGISIDVNAADTYSVTGKDGHGCIAKVSIPVSVLSLPDVSINNLGPVCLSGGPIDLNQGNPAGGIYSGTGISGNSFDPAAAGGLGIYTITYTYNNGSCSNSASAPLTVHDIPQNVGPISGPAYSACRNSSASYSVPAVKDANSYIWTATEGATIGSGQGTNAVVVNFGNDFNSGMLSVVANNDCGNTSPASLLINAGPSTPVAIFGDANPCKRGENTYWVDPVPGAILYTWFVPSGTTIVSGQGKDTLHVNTGGTTGNISVIATNGCDMSSAPAVLNVDVECRTMNLSGVNTENNSLGMLIYPNPAHDRLYIQFNSSNEDKYSLKIYDITGRVVMEESNNAEIGYNFLKLETNYAPGIYMISLTAGDSNKLTKIIIE